jgi:Arc/MetJ-type ribon-helix-helix transcriptional regulator
VRIPEAIKARVDQLVARGLYSDVSAAVTVALENLLVAEEEHRHREPSKPAAGKPQPSSFAEPEPLVEAIRGTRKAAGLDWAEPPSLPEKLIAPVPADRFTPGQLVPVERWVFGQQNRMLPAKINSRLLITLVADRKAEIELFEGASTVSDQAAIVFAFLNDLDARFENRKDDQLTTGFPEPDSDKALSRYANHFVAYESKEGNLSGMLLQWKFAGVKRAKNKTFLLPTQACIDFASLTNPLLDTPVTQKPADKFSTEETAWLLDHVISNVPVEASAFRTILEGLEARCNTPDALDKYVRENAKEKAEVTDAFVSTQRSGAVTRMADIGLVRRQRDGTKVTYELTDLATGWLGKLRAKSSE